LRNFFSTFYARKRINYSEREDCTGLTTWYRWTTSR